jgi:hypothetical protein
MGTSAWHLKQKKQRLEREIASNLDFVIGSVTSQGPRGGYSLTTKEGGKTRSKYIRTAMVGEVRKMSRRHQKLKGLLKELAELNWELLKAENQP